MGTKQHHDGPHDGQDDVRDHGRDERLGRRFMDAFRVRPGSKVDLGKLDPGQTFGLTKHEAKPLLKDSVKRLRDQQTRLWANGESGQAPAILIVLQGMDTAGKDGTIKHVFRGLNPSGTRVASFKVPTARELAHDYLWRVHRVVPARGEICIFNRSHYEDVLVVRVHDLVPAPVWRRRYGEIEAFERLLTDSGTRIAKFFLHISREEQRERLEARLARPEKRWKFKKGDLAERARWDDYAAAYHDALTKCSTEGAPWYVVPADHKWFRNLVVGEIIAALLEDQELGWPPGEPGLDGLTIS